MTTKYKSPYEQAFKTAVKRGTPFTFVVENIAKRYNKTTQFVWNSLWKAGCCYRQKFNGQWIYCPSFQYKSTSKNWKQSQFQMWQWYCDWAMAHGYFTPEQFKTHTGSQQKFQTWCKKYWGKQYTTTTTTKTKRRKTTTKTTRNYKFPTAKTKTKTKTRRYRKAA